MPPTPALSDTLDPFLLLAGSCNALHKIKPPWVLQQPTAMPSVPDSSPALHAWLLWQVVVVEHSAHGVDLPEDVASIEAKMKQLGIQ